MRQMTSRVFLQPMEKNPTKWLVSKNPNFSLVGTPKTTIKIMLSMSWMLIILKASKSIWGCHP